MAFWREEGGDDVEAIKKAAKVNGNQVSTLVVAEEFASQGRDVYTYLFDPEIPGDDVGSFHSSDLWFSFETLMKCWRPFDGHHFDLARKMCNYWTNFMKTGNPNGPDADGTPMPEWKKYTPDSNCIMRLFDEISLDEGPLSKTQRFITDINLKAFRKDRA